LLWPLGGEFTGVPQEGQNFEFSSSLVPHEGQKDIIKVTFIIYIKFSSIIFYTIILGYNYNVLSENDQQKAFACGGEELDHYNFKKSII
jgi:hypothetical protein